MRQNPSGNKKFFRLSEEAKFFDLNGFQRRDFPYLVIGLVDLLILMTGFNLAYAAAFSKDLLVDI